MRHYWLFKSEPSEYSIDDLKRDGVEHWDGTRNYQVRNMMRDEIKKGDRVLFYHSNSAKDTGVVGVAIVVKEGYPDFTAEDPHSAHPDPKHTADSPIWYMVDIEFEEKFPRVVTLQEIKEDKRFADMKLVQKGNRLSVFPVSKAYFDAICKIGHKTIQ
ncbi:MAG: EVE domain-containing protein [Patescibacteria group bacterium]